MSNAGITNVQLNTDLPSYTEMQMAVETDTSAEGFYAPDKITVNRREYPVFLRHHFYRMQGRKVAVAFNWHLKLFSLRDKPSGKVFGYTRAITLSWVNFDVDVAKAMKIHTGGSKTLHAYVVGEVQVGDMDATFGKWKWRLCYNPKKYTHFYTASTTRGDERCTGATAVDLWVDDGKAKMAAYLPVR
jgi:hypothetical protein